MRSIRPIIIIGFMGSGKTAVARELARKLNCHAIDLDELIALHEQRSPKEIFEKSGEDKFRQIETQMLRQVMVEGTAPVLAVGGGAWTVAENRKLLAEHRAFTVWLDAPFELCWKRIEAGGEVRPLARSREMAQKLYAERQTVYQLAEARIKIHEHENAVEIAEKIVSAT